MTIINIFDTEFGILRKKRERIAGNLKVLRDLSVDGKVGIGTSTPTVQLEIYDDILNEPVIRLNAGNIYKWDLKHDASTGPTWDSGFFITDVTNSKNPFKIETNTPTNLLVLKNEGYVGIGVSDPHSKLEVNGAISSATSTISASSDITDVSGINTLFINITGDIILGGLVGGVAGQVLHFVAIGNFINHFRLEHAQGIGGSQDFINHTAADEDISHGGCTYVCNGTNWYDCSHARHV